MSENKNASTYDPSMWEATALSDGFLAWANLLSGLLLKRNPTADPLPVISRWFGVDRLEITPRVDVPMLSYEDGSILDFGRRFEQVRAQSAGMRRDEGAYYTPGSVAQVVVRQVFDQLQLNDDLLAHVSVCDPAAGTGAFLIPAFHEAVQRLARNSIGERSASEAGQNSLSRGDLHATAIRSIFGIDIDLLTVAVLRSLLWLCVDAEPLLADTIQAQIQLGDALTGPVSQEDSRSETGFDWVRQPAFAQVLQSGGFSAIIGNPPWGALRPTISRWLPDSGETFDEYSGSRAQFASALRLSGGFKLQGKRDADLYRYFLERSLDLIGENGVLGLLIPGAFLRTEGASMLRRHLLQTGTFVGLTERLNTDRAFDIHPMFRYVEIVWARGSAGGIRKLSLGNRGSNGRSVPISMSRRYISQVSRSDWGIPDVRDSAQQRLLKKLTNKHPPLTAPTTEGWGVKFRREIDVTNATSRFVSVASMDRGDIDEYTLRPLYEGRMVHQHDAYAKAYVSGNGRSARWRVLAPQEKRTRPQFLVPQHLVSKLELHPRAGFCDITGHANERTVLAALIPEGSVAGNKVPTLEFDSTDPSLHLIWIAIANSFVIDWLVRRRISTTLNHFYWNQIPFPRVLPESVIGKELAAATAELSVWGSGDDGALLRRRARIRARIDVLVAQLFDLDEADIDLIALDFPLVDRSHDSDTTMALIRAGLSGADLNGASLNADVEDIPYVPAELARLLSARAISGSQDYAAS
jgi:hypothetical protein